MTALLRDLRFALRTLAKRPAFGLLVIAVLGIGIGAATAVVDLANLLAWRLLPAEQPRELVKIYTDRQWGFVGPHHATSYPDYLDYRDASHTLSGIAAHSEHQLRLDTGQSTRVVGASAISGNFFEVVGPGLAIGRGLEPGDDHPGAAPAMVIGHRLWQSLGADPGVLGRSMKVEGRDFTVVGVMAERFSGPHAGEISDAYLPIAHLPSLLPGISLEAGEDTDVVSAYLVGRMAPGRGREAVRAELQGMATRLDQERPREGDHARLLTVAAATYTHPVDLARMVPSLRLFAAAVALLLLITCANVAHLVLARSSARRREMAVRRSIGAGRGALIRQLLTESLVLALAGGLCGLALAFWARGLFAAFASVEFAGEMRFDGRVLGASFLICLGTTLLFGLAPAFTASRFDLTPALKDGAADGSGRRFPTGRLLAAAQVALCVVLLAVGALLAQSLLLRLDADRGFDSEGLLFAVIDLPAVDYDRQQGKVLFRRLRDRAAALPGVDAAARSFIVPPILYDLSLPYRLADETESTRSSRLNFIDGHYFETLGIELEQGRSFAPTDADSGQGVVIVNRRLAEEVWPEGDALGQTLHFDRVRPGDPVGGYTVIGVVSSVDQHSSSHGGEPVLYFDYGQRHRAFQKLVLRISAEPEVVVDSLRDLLREMDPGLALAEVRTGERNHRDAFLFEQMQALGVGLFAIFGLVLAVVGIFGVASYSVSRRIREIGIRMALGADRSDVRLEVARRDLAWALGGAAVGLAVTLLASRWLEHLLFGVSAADPKVLGGALVVVLLAAVLAVDLPARRAAKVDPLSALRQD